MSTVLAAVDSSAASRPVLLAATVFAHLLGATPRALHVRERTTATVEAEAASAGVPLRMVDGEPVPAIVRAAADEDVELVVLALHREPGASHEAGHTALAVVAAATKPVLVVPPRGTAPGGELKRVLVPLDGSLVATAAVRSTMRLFAGAGLDLIVLHVFDLATVPRFHDHPGHDLEAWAQEFFLRHCAEPGARLELRSGESSAAILDLAASEPVHLIAMGWAQDLAPERAHVVRRVMTSASCPVLLLPLAGPGPAGSSGRPDR